MCIYICVYIYIYYIYIYIHIYIYIYVFPSLQGLKYISSYIIIISEVEIKVRKNYNLQ